MSDPFASLSRCQYDSLCRISRGIFGLRDRECKTRGSKLVLAHLGANIRRLRLKGRETQEALAIRAGIEPRSLQRIEAGMTCSIPTIVRIAHALRMPIASLFRIRRSRPPAADRLGPASHGERGAPPDPFPVALRGGACSALRPKGEGSDMRLGLVVSVWTLAVAACGSSGGGGKYPAGTTTGGGCPAGLCGGAGGTCCTSTESCINNACCSASSTCGSECCSDTQELLHQPRQWDEVLRSGLPRKQSMHDGSGAVLCPTGCGSAGGGACQPVGVAVGASAILLTPAGRQCCLYGAGGDANPASTAPALLTTLTQACGSTCCNSDAICTQDQAGNDSCGGDLPALQHLSRLRPVAAPS